MIIIRRFSKKWRNSADIQVVNFSSHPISSADHKLWVMIRSYWRKLATTSALLLALYPQISVAETFTSAEFLTWNPEDQKYYLQISTIMAAAIVAQNDKAKSRCISHWNQQHEQDGYASVIKVMQENPSYHPQAIVIAVLQKACGSLRFSG